MTSKLPSIFPINLCRDPDHFLSDILPVHRDQYALGREIYRRLQLHTSFPDTEPDLLEIYLSDKLLSIRFDLLHDGHQYVALYTPISLVLSDDPPPPPPALIKRPLRILLTYGGQTPETADDQVISQLRDRANAVAEMENRRAVELTILRQPSPRDLHDKIQQAYANHTPFHIWHHIGECRSSANGPILSLFDGDLKPSLLQKMFGLLQPFTDAGCRLFVLHTPSIGAPLLPLLGQFPVPCAIGLTMGDASGTLIRGLYMRLLTHDVTNAVFAARLDRYIEKYDDDSWSALEMLCRTHPPRIVDRSWNRAVTRPSAEIPRLLFLRANPLDAQQGMLPIDSEIKKIKRALEWREGEFDMHDEGALEMEDFSRHLLKNRPNLLHFSGHGSNRGSLLWERGDSTKVYMKPEQIAPIIADLDTVSCVILNACYSTTLADLLAERGIVVIGMSQSVSNESATHFARGFYQALAFGENVAHAFKFATHEIGLSGATDEAHIPQIKNSERASKLYFFEQDDFKRRSS